MTATLHVWTDGACPNNAHPDKTTLAAGVGVYWGARDHPWNVSRVLEEGPPTNQRAELMAIYDCLRILDANNVPHTTPVIIYSDSMYAINCLTRWTPAWLRQNWQKRNGKDPVCNRDIIEPAYRLLCARPGVQFKWVKGHAHNVGNQEADRLAREAVE